MFISNLMAELAVATNELTIYPLDPSLYDGMTLYDSLSSNGSENGTDLHCSLKGNEQLPKRSFGSCDVTI